MKILSDLESLDNVKDGSTRKLNNIEVTESTNVNPFIFTGKQPGMYSLTGDYDTHYFKGSSTDAALNIYSDTVFIIADYASASNNDVIGYIENTRMVSTSLMTYTIEILKDTAELTGFSLGTSTTNTLAQGLDISGQDQTISGVKTFSSLPVSSGTPTSDTQLVNKAYVDSIVRYIDLSQYVSSSNPLILSDLEPGLYINSTKYYRMNLYMKLDSTYSSTIYSVAGSIPYVHILKKGSDAQENEIFAEIPIDNYYTTSSSTSYVKYDNRQYICRVKKDTTKNSGLVKNETYNSYTYPINKIICAYSYSSYASSNTKVAYSDATIQANTYFILFVDYNNSAKGALSLNINSGGAKPLYHGTTRADGSGIFAPTFGRGTYIMFYDGTNYYYETDGTIPKVVHGDESIKRIVEISYADYQTLVANNTVDPKTEYHIVDNDTTYAQDMVSLKSLPLGAIIEYPATTNLPEGFLICDGSAISRTTYADLFAIIGTTFGAGDGSTTFNLPNKKGRVTVGIDSNDTDFDTIGETGGSKYLQAHNHTQEGHAGNIYYSSGGSNYWISSDGISSQYYSYTSGPKNIDTGNDLTTGNSGNLQPYIVSNYIIKVSETTALVAQVVDNLNSNSTTNAPSIHAVKEALKKAHTVVSFYRTSGWTTQSTTDVAIPNASATVTTTGGDVLITVTTSLNVTGNMAFVALYVDDTLHSEILCLNATIGSQALTASALVTNLNAGSHTFALKMHVQNSSNVGTVMTYNTQQMVIQEL